MKTIIRLLLAALVINGCFQGGRAAWKHYEFKDAVEQEARFGSHKTTSELRRRLVKLAEQYGVGLTPEGVRVEKRDTQTHVALAYEQRIPLVPRVYEHQRSLEIDLTVSSVHPIIADDPPSR